MKYALIHINEPMLDGYRVCEVSNSKFDVYKDLFWVTCPNEVTAEDYYYSDGEFKLIPVPPKPVKTPVETLGN